jgi:hypothetical protein
MSMPPSTGPWVKELQASIVRSLLQQVCVANKSAAGFWVWICDSAAGAAVQSDLCPHYVAPNERQVFDFAPAPRLMVSGVYVGASTGAAAFVAIAADDCYIEVAYQPFPL